MARRRKKTKWQNYWDKQEKKKPLALASIPMVQENLLMDCIEIPLLDTKRGCHIIYRQSEKDLP